MSKDLAVTIRGGTYEPDDTLVFAPEDSGTQQHSVTYRAYPGEKVVFSGGRRVTGRQPGVGKIWTAQAPGTRQAGWTSRNFYVNGRRATRARIPNADDKPAYWQLADAQLSGSPLSVLGRGTVASLAARQRGIGRRGRRRVGIGQASGAKRAGVSRHVAIASGCVSGGKRRKDGIVRAVPKRTALDGSGVRPAASLGAE